MTEGTNNLLINVLLISKEDAILARLLAERKKVEGDLVAKKQALVKAEAESQTRQKLLTEKQYHSQRDEKVLRDEREKLVMRRKTLGTLGDYKTQQAAAREIDHSSRELNSREEAVLTFMGEVEAIEKECEVLKGSAAKLRTELEAMEIEVKETLVNIESRRATHQEERTRLATLINPASLSLYNRVKDRFPTDPAVVIKNGNCGGCFMQVPPQLVVQTSKGDTLIKCRGCGRILYLEEQVAAA